MHSGNSNQNFEDWESYEFWNNPENQRSLNDFREFSEYLYNSDEDNYLPL